MPEKIPVWIGALSDKEETKAQKNRLKWEDLGREEKTNFLVLISPNEMQQYAGVYLLQNYSTCFGCLSHP